MSLSNLAIGTSLTTIMSTVWNDSNSVLHPAAAGEGAPLARVANEWNTISTPYNLFQTNKSWTTASSQGENLARPQGHWLQFGTNLATCNRTKHNKLIRPLRNCIWVLHMSEEYITEHYRVAQWTTGNSMHAIAWLKQQQVPKLVIKTSNVRLCYITTCKRITQREFSRIY